MRLLATILDNTELWYSQFNIVICIKVQGMDSDNKAVGRQNLTKKTT